jgi:uncharacterized membrane protein
MSFIEDYFINPIIEHTGYNIINTSVYAIIAIFVAFIIFKTFKKYFTKQLIYYTLPFILLGSTVRVITDATESSIDLSSQPFSNFLQAVLNSGVYNYGFLTATPGIYVVIGLITIFSLWLSIKLKKPELYPLIGLVLLIPNLLIVLLMIRDLTYLMIILSLSIVIFLIGNLILDKYKVKEQAAKIALSAHIIDGVSSFVAIEVFNRLSPQCIQNGICYFGQHVVERFFSELMVYGTVFFLALKVIFAIIASIVIEKEAENENEKYFIYLLIIIFGLAPGIRNLLRVTLGV